MRPALKVLDGQSYDVVVIGAGAVGCSSAQHLAALGYKVLLLDKSDIASGTSSRSSRLLYCGLAYFSPDFPLWQYILHPRELFQRVKTARLAMRCRTELVKTMPERLRHATFFFPVFRGGAFPGWKVDLGYRALGLFGSRDAPLAYRRVSAEKAAEEFPLIRFMDRTCLTSTAVFREYSYFWPERILSDTALDAERLGATLRTYCAVTNLQHDKDTGWTLDLEESAPGQNGTAQVHSRMVINATGPWIDRLIGRVSNQARRRLTGLKGVNLLVRLPDAFKGHGLETISSLKHPFYMFPWGDHHYFGPTDTVFEGDPDTVRVEADEVDYLLGEANRLFPSLNLTEKDVVYRWSGVRPRTNSDNHSGSKALTIHDLAEDGLPDMLAVTGTPIMVHRHAGREIAKRVKKRLHPTGTPQALSYAARLMPADIRTESGVSEAEILHAVRTEHVVTLTDLIMRRLPTGWKPDMGFDDVERICTIAATELNWSPARQKQECEAYRAQCLENFEPRLSADPQS